MIYNLLFLEPIYDKISRELQSLDYIDLLEKDLKDAQLHKHELAKDQPENGTNRVRTPGRLLYKNGGGAGRTFWGSKFVEWYRIGC